MRITYDPTIDALYIMFKEVNVTTKHIADGINVDYDSDDKLSGIEILDALKRFGDKNVFKKITLEEIALDS